MTPYLGLSLFSSLSFESFLSTLADLYDTPLLALSLADLYETALLALLLADL